MARAEVGKRSWGVNEGKEDDDDVVTDTEDVMSDDSHTAGSGGGIGKTMDGFALDFAYAWTGPAVIAVGLLSMLASHYIYDLITKRVFGWQ